MTILILTNEDDVTADFVILGLKRRRIPFVRFNHEDFPARTQMAWTPEAGASFKTGKWNRLDDFASIWYRRSAPPRLRGHGAAARAFITAEAREALQGAWATSRARWISHPRAIQAAEGKLSQLVYAREAGMATPPTLVTNSPHLARQFWRRHEKRVIAKPLREKIIERAGRRKIIFTEGLENEDEENFASVAETPVLFQARIPKKFDLRVTAIGTRIFGTRIDSQTAEATRVDWRKGNVMELHHEPYELDASTRKFCERMLHDLKLEFGAFDFVVTPKDEIVFLELNPNGQWAWIEPLTKQPLREAMIDHLLGGAR